MKRQFLFNIFLLIFLNALIKPFWVFGIDRSVQNLVGSEAYGIYFALFNFSILFNSFLDFGITNFNNRSISQSPSLIRQYLPQLVILKSLLGVIYIAFCLVLSVSVGYSKGAVILILILAFNQFLTSFLLFLRSNISGLQLYTADSFISITDKLLLIILCSMLLWTNVFSVKLNVLVFALTQTIAYTITCILALTIVIKKSGRLSFANTQILSTDLFRKSLPFALLAFLMAFHNRIDAVLVERILVNGAAEAGIYAQSYRIFDALTMIPVLFASLLLPMFSRLISVKENIIPLLKLSFSMLFTGMAVLAVILSVFSVPLLDILYTESHPQSSDVFVLLCFSIIPVSLSYIFGTLLTAAGNLSTLNKIAGISLLINMGLNFILIPKVGITGAALTAFISNSVSAIIQIVVCKIKYRLHLSWRKVWPYAVLFILITLTSLMLNRLTISLAFQLIFAIFLSILLVFSLKIISFKEIISTFRIDIQR